MTVRQKLEQLGIDTGEFDTDIHQVLDELLRYRRTFGALPPDVIEMPV
jgi:hypothetical protein